MWLMSIVFTMLFVFISLFIDLTSFNTKMHYEADSNKAYLLLKNVHKAFPCFPQIRNEWRMWRYRRYDRTPRIKNGTIRTVYYIPKILYVTVLPVEFYL